jgi:hypothetical protein
MSNPTWRDPDPMREQYRELSEVEAEQMAQLKQMGRLFHQALDLLGESRELSIAKQSIEAAVMWATKHITAPVQEDQPNPP